MKIISKKIKIILYLKAPVKKCGKYVTGAGRRINISLYQIRNTEHENIRVRSYLKENQTKLSFLALLLPSKREWSLYTT